MFSSCSLLETYEKVTRDEIIPNGYLHSKTFFTNLRNLGKFPESMFGGCSKVNMIIDSE